MLHRGLQAIGISYCPVLKRCSKQCPEGFSFLERYISDQRTIYYNQTSVLGKLHNILECSNIPYAVIKGAHVREILYSPPWLRPCEDIDILIDPKDKYRVAEVLTERGFKARPDINTIANDLTLSHGRVSVDVHWDILRPGRFRHPLTEYFLSARINQNGYFSLTPEANLFIMLIHPVFKKYLTTPHAYLSRIIDLHSWIAFHSSDWEAVFGLCDNTGLKTAAWLTSTHYGLLTGSPLDEIFVKNVKPPRLKAAYLNRWLKYDLSTRFLGTPLIPQIFFTLAAHDTITSSCRFLLNNRESKKQLQEEVQIFQKIAGH